MKKWWSVTRKTAEERANDPRNACLIRESEKLMSEFSKEQALWLADRRKRLEARSAKQRSA